jgi:2-phospho-L-lactate guanylyltransferase (CobY/MobA/RfbA family)
MARRIIVYRDYRPGKKGKFVSEQTYNRSKAQGKTRHIHKEIISRVDINSVDDLFDVQDDDDLIDYEYHGTGEYGEE